MSYYEVESQSQYMIELTCVENIEDVADDFLTEEEVKEMGLSLYGSTQYFSDRIEAALILVKQSIKPGKKSAIIKDNELLEALKNNYHSCGQYLTNTRRVGNRLFYYPQGTAKIQEVPSYKNWKSLAANGIRYMNDTYDIVLDLNLPNSDRVKTVEMLQKVCTWEELEEYWADEDRYYTPDEDTLPWLKMMWEDLKTIPVPSSN